MLLKGREVRAMSVACERAATIDNKLNQQQFLKVASDNP